MNDIINIVSFGKIVSGFLMMVFCIVWWLYLFFMKYNKLSILFFYSICIFGIFYILNSDRDLVLLKVLS